MERANLRRLVVTALSWGFRSSPNRQEQGADHDTEHPTADKAGQDFGESIDLIFGLAS